MAAETVSKNVLQHLARENRLLSVRYRTLPLVPCNTDATRNGLDVQRMFQPPPIGRPSRLHREGRPRAISRPRRSGRIAL
jgi:hypothetical protein